MPSKYWDRAWSLVEGCTPVSEACDNCWLANWEHRFRVGNTDKKGRFNGKIELHPERLEMPLRAKKPKVWAIWSDLFHRSVPDEFIYKALNVMDKAVQHTFLVLTKRPERLAQIPQKFCDFMSYGIGQFETRFSHVWFGTTVENQKTADERIPHLLRVPGNRFLSMEPLLGPVDVRIPAFNGADSFSAMAGIHWITCGGESGPHARPTHPDWVRSIRDQCAAAGVPFHFKQFGEWGLHPKPPRGKYWGGIFLRPDGSYGNQGEWWDGQAQAMDKVGKKAAGRTLDGKLHDDMPWKINT